MSVLETFKLDGKVAVVTGAGGLYGRQVAQTLAQAGATVFAASRNLDKLEEAMKVYQDEGLNITCLTVDQGEEASVADLHKAIVDQTGRVDVLVNNAVLRPMSDWDSPIEEFALSMKVNVTGIFLMTRTFGDHMAKQGSGSIINIGSIQGMVGPDFSLYEGLGWGVAPDYFVHKGGMLQLTRYAASKLGPQGVRVNTISPGGFFADQDEIFVKRYNQRTFLGRMANDEDLKGVIVFLASDASKYITGTNIPVDGGYTAK